MTSDVISIATTHSMKNSLKPMIVVFSSENLPNVKDSIAKQNTVNFKLLRKHVRGFAGQPKRCWVHDQLALSDDFGFEFEPINELLAISSNTTETYDDDVTLSECDGLCAIEAAYTIDTATGACVYFFLLLCSTPCMCLQVRCRRVAPLKERGFVTSRRIAVILPLSAAAVRRKCLAKMMTSKTSPSSATARLMPATRSGHNR